MFSQLFFSKEKKPVYFGISVSNQFRMFNNSIFVRNESVDDNKSEADRSEDYRKRRERVKEKYGEAINAHQDFVFDTVDDASKTLESKINAKAKDVIRDTNIELEKEAKKTTEKIAEKSRELDNKIGEVARDLTTMKKVTKNTLFGVLGMGFLVTMGVIRYFNSEINKTDEKLKSQQGKVDDVDEKLKEQKDTFNNINQETLKKEKSLADDVQKNNQLLSIMLVKPMTSTFSDSSDTDYDREIETTRKKINNDVSDPCEARGEMAFLIRKLNMIKEEYTPRPCLEGYCFGLFTPHRSRIDKRISEIRKEKVAYDSSCERFKKLGLGTTS